MSCAVGLLILAAFASTVTCKILPDYLPICPKQHPNYSECVRQGLEEARPYFIKGIKELNVPPIEPFELPVLAVDRNVNDLVAIKAVAKNVKVLGLGNTVIESVRADPQNMTGEIRVTVPWAYLTMEYDATGHVLVLPIQSKGHFRGNFTNTKIYARGNAKLIEKDGEKYFKVDKFQTKIRVEDGWVKLTSKNPDMQFAADLITNFFNENPRRFMDVINPIFVEASTDLFRVMIDQALASVPAKELLPES